MIVLPHICPLGVIDHSADCILQEWDVSSEFAKFVYTVNLPLFCLNSTFSSLSVVAYLNGMVVRVLTLTRTSYPYQ